jgi:hypothetical protein
VTRNVPPLEQRIERLEREVKAMREAPGPCDGRGDAGNPCVLNGAWSDSNYGIRQD